MNPDTNFGPGLSHLQSQFQDAISTVQSRQVENPGQRNQQEDPSRLISSQTAQQQSLQEQDVQRQGSQQQSSQQLGPQQQVSQRGQDVRGSDRSRNPRNPSSSRSHSSTVSLSQDGFPPLGSNQAVAARGAHNHSRAGGTQTSSDSSLQLQPDQRRAREYFDTTRGGLRVRGYVRGSNTRTNQQHNNYRSATSGLYPSNQLPMQPAYHQPRPVVNNYQNHTDQQGLRLRSMEQADYLNHLSSINLKNSLTKEEMQEKHNFRKALENIAQDVCARIDQGASSLQPKILLQSYGSLANSFGVAGCDMDLMLTLQLTDGSYLEADEALQRSLEKAILEAGFGARLLTKTRVPILRACQKPSPELLQKLKLSRETWELEEKRTTDAAIVELEFAKLPVLNPTEGSAAWMAFMELDGTADQIPLPPSPGPEPTQLEFDDDCGVECDINFTNHVALHNTKLLWTYGQCDMRVRQMGIFVKNWAKARDINTPYRGTLSSYGYILMVLHYLMNVVKPPVIPNLQTLQKDQDRWARKEPTLFEGFDVRFVRDMAQVKSIMQNPKSKNNESLGGLLRGFFQYFSTSAGFNWTREVISIRTPGGILEKHQKGWTEAKWSAQKQTVRLRYLLAIEDPFETEHNIARTVGHHGVCAIRDEFRRAWQMILGIHHEAGMWIWSSDDHTESRSGDELIERADKRGDLHRKDAQGRKQKQINLKKQVEVQEEAMRSLAVGSKESTNSPNVADVW